MGPDHLKHCMYCSSQGSLLLLCVCHHGPERSGIFYWYLHIQLIHCWFVWSWLLQWLLAMDAQSNFCMYFYYTAHIAHNSYEAIVLVTSLFCTYMRCNHVQSKQAKPEPQRKIMTATNDSCHKTSAFRHNWKVTNNWS